MQHCVQPRDLVRSTQNSDKDKPHSENDVKHKTEPGLEDGIQLGEGGCQAPLPERNAEVTDKRAHNPQQRHSRSKQRMSRSRETQTQGHPPDTTRKGKRKAKVPTPPLRHVVLSVNQR